MNWSISKSIAGALFAILLLFFCGMMTTFLITTSMLQNSEDLLRRLTSDIAMMEELRDSVHEQDIEIRNYVLTGKEQYLASIRSIRARAQALLGKLQATISDEQLRQQLGTVRLMLAQYDRKIDFIALVHHERGAPAATRYLEYGEFANNVEQELDEMVRLVGEQANRFIIGNLTEAGHLHFAFTVIFIISLLSAAVIAWRINAMIMRPLNSLVAGARSVSKGNFDCTVLTTARNEFAEVGAAFNQMAASLKQFFSKLEQEERKYRELADLLPIIVYEADSKGYFTYTNRAGYETIGFSPEDLQVGVHGTKVIAEQYVPQLQEGMERIARGETLLNREYVVRRKDGSTFPALFFTVPIIEQGAVVGARGIVVNMTEIKQAADSLQKSEDKYRSIFEQSNDGIFLVDAAGCISEWNRRMAEITKIPQQEALGLFIWDVEYTFLNPAEKTPENYDRMKNTIQQWLVSDMNSRENKLLELKIYLADGSVRHIQDTIFSIQTKKELLWGVIARDITEQKKNEEERARLAAAIEQADEAVVITDPAGIIQYVNPAFTKVSGYGRQETIGKNISILKSGRHDRAFYENLWRTITRGDTWRGIFFNRKKDGTAYDESAVISPIRTAAGEITNFVSVKRDITRELRTEAHLRQAQKIEAIGTLAGGIAHDFNNILGVILGFSELTIDQLRDRPELYGNLQQVMIAADRAKDLIRQILSISRQTEAAERPLSVMPIAKEIVRFMRASLPTTIEIRQKLLAPSDRVVADPIELHQVLMNLCTNAGHAMKEHGGVLELTLQNISISQHESERIHLKPGEYVLISVSDTGQGIAPENLDRIFEPYFTTKKPGEGTGLGLAVAQGIILSRGGDIRVYSELGKGTTFHVYLPVSEKEKTSSGDFDRILPTGKERILFIDDEDALVKIGMEILTKLGYAVTGLTDSEAALEAFKTMEGGFDLVITDKTMPKMTGFDLAREMKKLRPETPIVLCTGFIEKNEPEKKQAGIDKILAKPINQQILAQTVRMLLDRPKKNLK